MKRQDQSQDAAQHNIFLAWLGLRCRRLTLAALPPNLVPICVGFGAMAWFRFPLDAGTVMVAAVALGIAVDNTIHYLVEYARARNAGAATPEAATAAIRLVAPAIADTTFAACTGFLALTVSAFLPIRHFGILMTVMLVVALGCHLFLTPSLLTVASAHRARRVEES